MALIILIFVFYYVPESRDKLGIFPEKSLSEAIGKYGVEDDDDMVNLIDNIQKTVGPYKFLIYNSLTDVTTPPKRQAHKIPEVKILMWRQWRLRVNEVTFFLRLKFQTTCNKYT